MQIYPKLMLVLIDDAPLSLRESKDVLDGLLDLLLLASFTQIDLIEGLPYLVKQHLVQLECTSHMLKFIGHHLQSFIRDHLPNIHPLNHSLLPKLLR